MSEDNENIEIDFDKVGYDDVLHLYRGWRRSESDLQLKSTQYDLLHQRAQQLQESLGKFRAQILSLESVKDFAIKLQSELNVVHQENKILLKQNNQLSSCNVRVEAALASCESSNKVNVTARVDSEAESAVLRENYELALAAQKSLEQKLIVEREHRASAESSAISNDRLISFLKTEIRDLTSRAEINATTMLRYNQESQHAVKLISSLTQELEDSVIQKDLLSAAESETATLKGDISRLLRLLHHYPSSEDFSNRWHASDGMSFLGMSVPKGCGTVTSSCSSFKALNTDYDPCDETKREEVDGDGDGGEFDEFQDRTFPGMGDVTPREYALLRDTYSGDPFPMCASFEEEADLWVPREVRHIGMIFTSKKIPHAPPKLITEFLRKINKVWLRREKRLCGKLKDYYSGEIADLKRRVANLKPYRDVVAESDTKRLKNQIKEGHLRALKGRPRTPTELGWLEGTFTESDATDIGIDIGNHDDYIVTLRKDNINSHRVQKKTGGSVLSVSKNMLLEASLQSLESLGRQRLFGVPVSSGAQGSPILGKGRQQHPPESYIRGALWLGSNLLLLIEEVAESLDMFRTTFIAQVTAAASDPQLRRSRHRLSLLATACIHECLTVTNIGRVKARDIFQGVARMSAGDTAAFQDLLKTLPIDSSPLPLQQHTKKGKKVNNVRSRTVSPHRGNTR